jgi:heme exporter protein A
MRWTSTSVLSVEGLECERGGRVLFRALSFDVKGGELLRIAGDNGSGKTSLLRILCGLLLPSEGEVRWRGENIRALREDFSRQLVYLGHALAVKDDLTPAENLSIALRIAGISPEVDKVNEALARFGLGGIERPVRQLSQGQRRRAALARLLLSEALPLWLLDEPFVALDAPAAKLTEELIAQQVARGATVVYTTHQESRIQGRVLNLDVAS